MHKTIKIDTWQFVRSMVALEERGRRGALWKLWSDTWREIDSELAALADTDFDAYSELMMRHRLELDLPTPHLRLELIAALKHVVNQYHEKLNKPGGLAPSQRHDIEFENSEIKKLIKELDPEYHYKTAKPKTDAATGEPEAESSLQQKGKARPDQKRRIFNGQPASPKPKPKVQRAKATDGRGNLRAGVRRPKDKPTGPRHSR